MMPPTTTTTTTTTMKIVGRTSDYQIWAVTMNRFHLEHKSNTEIELGGLIFKSYPQNFIPKILDKNFPNSKSMAVVTGFKGNNIDNNHGVYLDDVLCVPDYMNDGSRKWTFRLGCISKVDQFQKGESLLFYVARAKSGIIRKDTIQCKEEEQHLPETISQSNKKRRNNISHEDQPQAKRPSKQHDTRVTQVVTPSMMEKSQAQKTLCEDYSTLGEKETNQSSESHVKSIPPTIVSTGSKVSSVVSPLKKTSPSGMLKNVANTSTPTCAGSGGTMIDEKSTQVNDNRTDMQDHQTMKPSGGPSVDSKATTDVLHSHEFVNEVPSNDHPSNEDRSSNPVVVEENKSVITSATIHREQEQEYDISSMKASLVDMMDKFHWYKDFHNKRLDLIKCNDKLHSDYNTVCFDIVLERRNVRQAQDWFKNCPFDNINLDEQIQPTTTTTELKQFTKIQVTIPTGLDDNNYCPYQCLGMYAEYLTKLKAQNQEMYTTIQTLKLELSDLKQKMALYKSLSESLKTG